jgi:Ca-activated chloride channel homolog
MKKNSSLYTRLEIPPDASPEQIRRAYREAARKLHPDKNIDPGDTQLFLEIQEAYEVLSDPERRAEYDANLEQDAGQFQPITINTLYSRSKLPRIKEPQLIYVTIGISPRDDDNSAYSPPTNICLVIDSSTSMQGVCMDTVKETAIQLTRQLKPNDVFSLVSFNDRAEVLISGGTNQDYHKISSRIRMLQTGGGTEIFQGLQAGVSEVTNYRRRGSFNHVILLTDGHTYGDEAACLELASQAASLGFGITALGIGTRWNDIFLDSIASRTGGASIFIASPDQIPESLSEVFDGIRRSFAENINYRFELGPSVELKYAFRLQPQAGPLGVDSPLVLGKIPKNGNSSMILEFLVKEVPRDVKFLNLTNGSLLLNSPSPQEKPVEIRLDLTRDIGSTTTFEAPPPSIMQAMSRLTLYRMQEQAQKELESGHAKEATRRLQNLATHLLSMGESDLALAVLKEVDNINNSRSLSDEGIKRIKYGTRSLIRPPS